MKIKPLVIIISQLFITACISSCHSGAKDNTAHTQKNQSAIANVTSQDWYYTRNSMDLIETVKDPNGNVTRYGYDAQGLLNKITNALGQTIVFADFDRYGHPQKIIDPNGIVTNLTYTDEGWLASSTTAGATTKFTYDNIGQLTQVILPDDLVIKYKWDEGMHLVEVSYPNGSKEYKYDSAGNVIANTIRNINGTTYLEQRSYDELNRLVMISKANSTNRLDYDSWALGANDNHPTATTDGRNNNTYFFNDGLGRLADMRDAKQGNTSYNYNNTTNIDSPSEIIDPRGIKTIYQYNGLSNLLKLISPDSGTSNYIARDGNGNLLQMQDARGNNITYQYDALNRPTIINYAADPSEDTSFAYDAAPNAVGRLIKLQNGISSTSYGYDEHGNTINELQHINNADYRLIYDYNDADRLINIVYPSGIQVTYSYSNGEVSNVTVNGKTIATISHMPFGPIKQIKYGNQVIEDISYNTDYTIKQFKLSNGLINREYSYYPNGQIKSISGVGNYDYDQLGALIKKDNNSYSYDRVSNRTSATINNQQTNYTIDNTSNKLLNSIINSIKSEYKYDSAGNQIKFKDIDYSYDNLNRLKTVAQAGKELASYQYNALSQRIMKNVSGNKTIFIYNSAGQLLEERNLQTNVTRDYIYVEGQLIAAVENGIIVYIVTDHLNAPQVVMDNTGQAIWSAKYDEFGKATITSGYKFNLRADGQYQDDETGLYYNWYRYYNPETGRYITSDPIGLAAGINTYIYVNGNPINYTDPTGRWWAPVVRATAVGFGIGTGVETTSELINAGLDVSKLQPSNILIAGTAGALTGGVGGAVAVSGMRAAGAIAINTVTGGVAGAGQQMATNSCNGDDLYNGVLDSTLWSGGLNGGVPAFAAVSRSILKNGATANFSQLKGTTSAKEATVPVIANAGEVVGSWSANFATTITQIYMSSNNSQSNR